MQPPSGETWMVTFAFSTRTGSIAGYSATISYYDFDGTTARLHAENNVAAPTNYPQARALVVERILSNSLYARLSFFNTTAQTGYYGYSGFKLSKPLWSTIRNLEPMPWKRPATTDLPTNISGLKKYAFDILGIDPTKPNEYGLGIVLEEDTPLAVDPDTNFPVERLTAVVKADVLSDLIKQFKSGAYDPVATGYAKYLNKWKAEGIDLV